MSYVFVLTKLSNASQLLAKYAVVSSYETPEMLRSQKINHQALSKSPPYPLRKSNDRESLQAAFALKSALSPTPSPRRLPLIL
jgi:hypothetical protein